MYTELETEKERPRGVLVKRVNEQETRLHEGLGWINSYIKGRTGEMVTGRAGAETGLRD